MNLFIVGWGLPRNYAADVRGALVGTLSAFPPLDPATLWLAGDGQRLVMASVHAPTHAMGARRYVWRSDRLTTLYDGTPAARDGGLAAHDAEALAEHWDHLVEQIEGPYVAVRVDEEAASVSCVTDPLGMRPLYAVTVGTGMLISNHGGLLSGIVRATAYDTLGVSSFLTWGWASGDRTLLREVRVIPGGQRWTWNYASAVQARHTYWSPKPPPKAPGGPTPDRILTLAEDIGNRVATLASRLDHISCGLTAGRDSRLLAAIFSHMNVPIRYVTYSPPETTEARIALQVAQALGLPHQLDSSAGASVVEAWEAIVPDFVLQNDGLVSLFQVRVMLNRERSLIHLPIFVGGHGGEIGRGFFVEPSLLLCPPSTSAVQRLLRARLVDTGGTLTTEDARRTSAMFLDEFVVQAVDEGFLPRDVPDAFYLRERVGRWASSVIRPSLPVSDVFVPFCTRPFVDAVFDTSTWQRYSEDFHLTAIMLLAPSLRDVPFEKGARKRDRILKDLLRGAARVPGLRAMARRRRASVPEAAWIEPLLPRLRSVCLDQSASELWLYADRSAFERLTGAQTSHAERAGHVEGLLQVVTLFEHAAATRASQRAIRELEPAAPEHQAPKHQ